MGLPMSSEQGGILMYDFQSNQVVVALRTGMDLEGKLR